MSKELVEKKMDTPVAKDVSPVAVIEDHYEAKITLKDATANPAPLGLLAFGLTTVLLNIHNAGLYPLNAMVLAMGIFYGGFGQIIVGIMEWKKNNLFGMTAFCSYGIFWLTFAGLIAIPKFGIVEAADPQSMGFYLALWGFFTLVMFIGTLRQNRALQFVFGSLTILFALLAIGDFTGNGTITMIAGFEGIICGLSAIYTGLAQVLNNVYKKTVLPLGAILEN